MVARTRRKTNNPVLKTVIQEKALQPPAIKSSFELPVVSPSDPRIRPLGTSPPEEYDYADYEIDVSMSVFDAENQIWELFACSEEIICNFKTFQFGFLITTLILNFNLFVVEFILVLKITSWMKKLYVHLIELSVNLIDVTFVLQLPLDLGHLFNIVCKH